METSWSTASTRQVTPLGWRDFSAPPTGAGTPAWSQGNQLLVCVQVKERSLTGFVPYPTNGILKTKTYMSIEVPTPVVDPTYNSDAAPAGSDWSWCS